MLLKEMHRLLSKGMSNTYGVINSTQNADINRYSQSK